MPLAALFATVFAFIEGSNFLPISNLAFALLTLGVYFVLNNIKTIWLQPRILGQSVLFSGSTYTAMGFMDDLLPGGWKMLAIIIAFSGMFAFAWTASVMISMTKNFRQAYTRLHMKKLNLPAEVIERFK